jgi:hypothetical protein
LLHAGILAPCTQALAGNLNDSNKGVRLRHAVYNAAISMLRSTHLQAPHNGVSLVVFAASMSEGAEPKQKSDVSKLSSSYVLFTTCLFQGVLCTNSSQTAIRNEEARANSGHKVDKALLPGCCVDRNNVKLACAPAAAKHSSRAFANKQGTAQRSP